MTNVHSLSSVTLLVCLGAAPFAQSVGLGEFKGTEISINGFLKAQGIYEKIDDGDSSFAGRANESRVNLKTVTEKSGHTITGFVEGDFYGGTFPGENNDLRLRHAFVKIDNTTVGQTWTGQFWAVAYQDYLDFFGGPRGTLGGLNFRTTLVSQQIGNLRLTAQDPVTNEADVPDLAVNYNLKLSGGHTIIFTASGREVENGDFVVGGAIGSKIMIGPHNVSLNAHYGKGLGAFTGVGAGNSLAEPDVENGDAIKQKGFDAGFQYLFSSEWRANIAFTAVDVDDDAETNYEAYRTNVIHKITEDLEVGLEWRKYNLAFGPLRPEGQQVEIMAKYIF